MRLLGVLTIVCMAAACRADRFSCGGDGECMLGGEQGQCVGGNCAYPDAMCPSGYRYAEGLGNGLAGQCVDEDDLLPPATDAMTSGPSTSSGTTATSSESSDSGGMTSASDSTTGSTSGVSTSSTTDEPTGPLTSAETVSSSITGMVDTGLPSGCEERGCADCFQCAADELCATEAANCENAAGCSTIVACLNDCVLTGVCFEACCEAAEDQTVEAAQALHVCQVEACSAVCEGNGEASCL